MLLFIGKSNRLWVLTDGGFPLYGAHLSHDKIISFYQMHKLFCTQLMKMLTTIKKREMPPDGTTQVASPFYRGER